MTSRRFAVRPLSRAEVRDVDRRAVEAYGMTSLVLMENAGGGAARVIDAVAPPGQVAILCGSGNNAGDGYVAARHLQVLGRQVALVQLVDPSRLRGDAAVNWNICVQGGVPATVIGDAAEGAIGPLLQEAGTIVDAMLGTGASGDPRPPMAAAIHQANAAAACRIALDLPSGLDCDTGHPGDPCFRADHTCTFVAPKIGFAEPRASRYVGQVHVIAIGVPRDLLQRL